MYYFCFKIYKNTFCLTPNSWCKLWGVDKHSFIHSFDFNKSDTECQTKQYTWLC